MNSFDIIGQGRLEIYEKNKFPISKALKYFQGNGKKYESNMIGYECEYQLVKHLQQLKAKNIKTEVDIGNTAIDVLCMLNNELTALESKTSISNNKCVKQIRKYKGHYKNAKVLVAVPKQTKISESIQNEVKSIDGGFLFLDLTKQDLLNELLNIQKQFKALY